MVERSREYQIHYELSVYSTDIIEGVNSKNFSKPPFLHMNNVV